jgi:hypothetical protein
MDQFATLWNGVQNNPDMFASNVFFGGENWEGRKEIIFAEVLAQYFDEKRRECPTDEINGAILLCAINFINWRWIARQLIEEDLKCTHSH